MRSKIIQLVLLSVAFPVLSDAQFNFMLGYVDMREARIWLGNNSYTQAQIHYRESGRFSAHETLIPITLNENNQYTTTAVLSPLKPGTAYTYWVEANDPAGVTALIGDTSRFTTQPLWQFRSEPPNFTLATGSCSFINVPELDRPGDPFGGEYGIYSAIAAKKPNVMVWLGDNIYLREADYHCETCIDERYLHSRS